MDSCEASSFVDSLRLAPSWMLEASSFVDSCDLACVASSLEACAVFDA